ncbi:hypothetical protein ACLI4Q_04815 [Natrialbaceae archaeon A-CW1-1]
MNTLEEYLFSASFSLPALGFVAGFLMGGPIGAALLGIFGFVAGIRLDKIDELERGIEQLKD